MALEILLGKSSSDHEGALLTKMQKVLAQDPKARTFYLVPNHIKFESEIDVINRLAKLMHRQGSAIAIPHMQVFSLSRLSWYYMQNDPLYYEANLSTNAMVMLVEHLLKEYQDDLVLYQNMLTKQGFVSQFAQQLLEVKQSGVTWNKLKEIAHNLSAEQTLARKLKDLALIGQALDDNLTNRGQYLNSELLTALKVFLATDKVDLKHHYFFINRYAQMTEAERGVVEVLIREAGGVTIALPADRGTASLQDVQEHDLFYRPKQLARQLRDYAQAEGVAVEIEAIQDQRPLSDTMRAVEQFWIDYEQQGVTKEQWSINQNNFKIWQTSSLYQEVEQIARTIRQAVALGKRRYQDYLLVARDLGPYENVLPAIFNKYDLPFFMDADRSMNNHPLVAFLQGLLGLAPKYALTDVLALLKTELLIPAGVEIEDYREALAITENYALAKNIAGKRFLKDEVWHYDPGMADHEDLEIRQQIVQKDQQLALIHEQMSKVVGPWLKQLENSHDASEMARLVYQFMIDQGIDQRLLNWRDEAVKANHLEEAQQPEQVWRTLMGLLDDFVDVFDHDEMTRTQLADILTAGFENAKYTGIPATMDQVRVSESGIVQGQDYQTVIVFGATANQLPATSANTALLNDTDRAALAAWLPDDSHLQETAERQMAQETLLMYSAFMSAQQSLIWSYATTDGDKEQHASTYITRMQKQFNLPVEHFAALPDPKTDAILPFVGSPQSTLAQLVIVNRIAKHERVALSPAWQQLQQQVAQLLPQETQRLMNSLTYVNQPSRLQPGLVKTLFGEDLYASVSRLQTYAQNPFAFFLQYGLKLREREVMTLTPAERGTLLHAILEGVFGQLMQAGQPLGSLTVADLVHLVDEVGHQVLTSGDPTFDIFTSSARMRYTSEQLMQQVATTLQAMRRGQPNNQRIQTAGTELPFGMGKQGLAGLKYSLPQGSVSVRGKIDRYDTVKVDNQAAPFLTVVDYKSSQRKFELAKVLAGLELQLVTYWLALEQDQSAPVGAAVYWNAQTPWLKVKDLKPAGKGLTDLQAAADQALSGQGKYQGIILRDDALLDQLTVPENQAPIFGFSRTKSGALSKSGNDTFSQDELTVLKDYNKYQVQRIAAAILAGDFPLWPYRNGTQETALMNTPYKPVMFFDPLLGNHYHDLKGLPQKRETALEAMQRTLTQLNNQGDAKERN